MASFHCPYSRHQLLMSGIWPVFTVHIPDIGFFIKLMSGIRTVMSGIWTMMSGIWTMNDAWNMDIDVRNMDSDNWPFSGHQEVMSGIWTVKTGHIPDIEK